MRLPEDEARARFASVPLARLGTAGGQGRPHLVVTTFVVDGDTIYKAVVLAVTVERWPGWTGAPTT